MATAPQSGTEMPQTASVPDAALIREQLNRVLAYSLFSRSKRYPVFLAYIVEQTLLGNAADLKERTIGAEAFGRRPDYDVNQDPVVRTSAAEVRKRLIQYYYDSAHAGELVIELSAGSYVPAFRLPEPQGMDAAELAVDAAADSSSSVELEAGPEDFLAQVAEPALPNAETSLTAKSTKHIRWVGLAALVVVTLAVGIGIGRYHSRPPVTDMARFWEPITSSQGPVTYCIGEPGTFEDLKRIPSNEWLDPATLGRLNISDVVTLARSIVPLDPRKGGFRVLSSSDASFAQLREGPIVLIGAISNLWTLRITAKLRFGFEMKDGVGRLVDRKGPHPTSWSVQRDPSSRKVVRDYAIVARIHDDTTGQPVILIAGILGTGTEAAGEVIYNPTYLDLLLQKAPRDWERKNLEALIETSVFESNPGPPNILAVETW
jgi:hypothetical protein